MSLCKKQMYQSHLSCLHCRAVQFLISYTLVLPQYTPRCSNNTETQRPRVNANLCEITKRQTVAISSDPIAVSIALFYPECYGFKFSHSQSNSPNRQLSGCRVPTQESDVEIKTVKKLALKSEFPIG